MSGPKKDNWISYLIFHRFSSFNYWLSVVCSLIKRITPKIRMLCFVLIKSIILNL